MEAMLEVEVEEEEEVEVEVEVEVEEEEEEEEKEEEEEDKKVLKEDRIWQMRSAQHWLTTLSTTAWRWGRLDCEYSQI